MSWHFPATVLPVSFWNSSPWTLGATDHSRVGSLQAGLGPGPGPHKAPTSAAPSRPTVSLHATATPAPSVYVRSGNFLVHCECPQSYFSSLRFYRLVPFTQQAC